MLSENNIKKLKANPQDILYLGDQRWYLGGLRSSRFRLASKKIKEDSLVFISQKSLNKTYLLSDRLVFVKKII